MKKPLVSASPVIDRINVTPIIDVALVLVIILLVTAPLLSVADLKLQLPYALARGAEEPPSITLTMSATGELAVDDEVTRLEGLPRVLKDHLRDLPDDALLVVRADEALLHQDVRQVIDTAKVAGARRIAIATSQKVDEE